MIDPILVELMNRDLDGEITAAERQRLKQELEASVEARTEYDRLLLTAAALRGMPRTRPPETLKPSVMAAIQRLGAPARKEGYSVQILIGRLADWWAAGTSLRFLSGVAAGAALALILGSLFGFLGQPSLLDVRGTLAPPGRPATEVIGSWSVSAGRTSAEMRVKRLPNNQIVVEVRPTSPSGARIQLDFNPGDLSWTGAARNGQSWAGILQSPGHLQLPASSGGVIQVTFDDRTEHPSTIRVSLSDNEVTAIQEVTTGGGAFQK